MLVACHSKVMSSLCELVSSIKVGKLVQLHLGSYGNVCWMEQLHNTQLSQKKLCTVIGNSSDCVSLGGGVKWDCSQSSVV